MQKEDETVDDFIAALREPIKNCAICNDKDAMTDKVLKYVRNCWANSSLLEKLLQERAFMTLNQCIKTCRAAESASNPRIWQALKAEINQVNKVRY